MTTIAASPTARPTVDARSGPADVFVAFGITGDLAKVMTFMSLYRLERRGLIYCSIVRVGRGDWTGDQLKERARHPIERAGGQLDPKGFERLAHRPSHLARAFSP